ncbi:MAG: hypothetical protein ACJAS1_000823 [Oleiphilaceae bacterium]|jgi:hypothetical protein
MAAIGNKLDNFSHKQQGHMPCKTLIDVLKILFSAKIVSLFNYTK